MYWTPIAVTAVVESVADTPDTDDAAAGTSGVAIVRPVAAINAHAARYARRHARGRGWGASSSDVSPVRAKTTNTIARKVITIHNVGKR